MSCWPLSPRTTRRVMALASPNDPTGELLAAAELERLLDSLPEEVAVLLDESLIEFSDAQPHESSLAAARGRTRGCWSFAASPRPGDWRACASATRSADRARRNCWPSSSPTSASARSLRRVASRRCAAAQRFCVQRTKMVRAGALAPDRSAACSVDFEVTDSQANFLWVAHPAFDGEELAARSGPERGSWLPPAGPSASPGTCASRVYNPARSRAPARRALDGRCPASQLLEPD